MEIVLPGNDVILSYIVWLSDDSTFSFHQTMFCVRDQSTLASQLLRIVGQRLAHVILDASESSERANRLSRLPTQISSWIKSQVI